MNPRTVADLGIGLILVGIVWGGVLAWAFTPRHALAGLGVASLGLLMLTYGAGGAS